MENFNKVNKYIKDNNINVLSFDDLNKLKEDLCKKFDYNYDIITEICNRIFVRKYELCDNLSFDNGSNAFRKEKFHAIEIPKEYKKAEEHFNYLYNLPQPEQRSKEWYEYRNKRITASDTATAIDQNPYESIEGFYLKKCDPNFPFRDNATVFHGRKYEPIATMIYEHIYNTKVFEFGALPSKDYPYLGASPDGICSIYTLDNKFSTRLEIGLEIKCPVTRIIYIKGKIAGEICPYYYYCQIQQQLLCCELKYCDFWQCKLIEYKNKREYLIDEKFGDNTEGTDGTITTINNKLKKGLFLELYPRNFKPEFEDDNPEWKSKYIYPNRLDMTTEQYDSWALQMLDELKDNSLHKDYYFHRIVYWKLDHSHNVTIERDEKFLKANIPILKNTFEKMMYYRANLDKLPELQVIADRRKKYIKLNTSYKITNEFI